MIFGIIDKNLEKLTRRYIKFVVCSVLGLGLVFYIENEEVEDVQEVKNEKQLSTQKFALVSSIDEEAVRQKSCEIVRNIYENIA